MQFSASLPEILREEHNTTICDLDQLEVPKVAFIIKCSSMKKKDRTTSAPFTFLCHAMLKKLKSQICVQLAVNPAKDNRHDRRKM